LADKVHEKDGKKRNYCRYFEGFEEYFRHFDLKAEGAAVGFSYTVVIKNGSGSDYGKYDRKDNADCQNEEQDFAFQT
jgi:hypothetical protein